MREKFSLVIPTYNEAKNIEGLVMRILDVFAASNVNAEVIIVDDDSPDGTWEIAEKLSRSCPSVKSVRRRGERGLASAVVRGWQESSGDILGVIDGDFQHPPEALPDLIGVILKNKFVDIAVASRHVPGGGVTRWNIFRRAVSWLGALISAFFLPELLAKVRDPMSGYFALRKEVIADKVLRPSGYKILLEVLSKGSYRGVTEVPYFFKERQKGGSKAGIKEYFTSLFFIIRLSLKTGQIYRVIKYACVGIFGALVTLAGYLLCVDIGLGGFASYGIALEAAIICNFLLNEVWTFSDKSKDNPAFKARVTRFLEFNLICIYGAVFSFLVFSFLLKITGLSAFTCAAAGVGVGFLWNFIASSNSVWLSRFSMRKSKMEVEKGYYHRVLEDNRVQGYWHKKKFELVSAAGQGAPALDAGSGPGVFLHYHGGFPGLKVNLDSSLEQLQYGRALNQNALYVNALVSRFPFASGTFSTVFLIETIEHIDEASARMALSEISRSLKKGGKLVLTTPNYRSLWPLIESVISVVGAVDYCAQHVNRFDMRKICEYVSSCGLSVKKQETFFIISPFLSIISPKLSDFIFRLERKLLPDFGNIILIEAVKE
jgi:dolichol-phosphate mannosyltransferase